MVLQTVQIAEQAFTQFPNSKRNGNKRTFFILIRCMCACVKRPTWMHCHVKMFRFLFIVFFHNVQ